MAASTRSTGGKLDFKEFDQARRYQARLVKDYYVRMYEAIKNGAKVAYAYVMANPIELLMVFDIVPVYPEVTSLQISYKGGAPELIGAAEEFGYSTDCCGYVKMGIGALLRGGNTVIGKVPKPDILFLGYSGCQIYIHWWEQLKYIYNIPLITVDVPYYRDFNGHVYNHDIKYVTRQLEDVVIPKLEEVSGKRFDEERLKEIIYYSREAWRYWREAIHMGKLVPSPVDAYFEAIYYMSVITLLRGTPEAVEFYKFLVDELRRRYEAGVGPTEREDFRIVFEGVPNYPFFRRFWGLFKRWNARAVASTYPKVAGLVDVGAFRLDPEKPIESLAEYMIHAYCNWNMIYRLKLLERYVREYKADGVVIHSIKSCRSFSMGHGDIREYFVKERDIPALLIDSDHVDPRYFSEAQLRNRIDAFFEELSIRKGVEV